MEKLKIIFESKPIGQAPPGNSGPMPALMCLLLAFCGGKREKKINWHKKIKRSLQAVKELRLLRQKQKQNKTKKSAQQKLDSASRPRRFRDLEENPKTCNISEC